MSSKKQNKKQAYKKYNKNNKSHLTKAQRQDVKKIIKSGTELKYNNYNQSGFNVTNSPTVAHISGNLLQGVTDLQRIGDRVMLDKCWLRLFANSNFATSGFAYVRAIFFQWKSDSNTNPPLPADILLPGSSGSVDYTSQYNHDQRMLFRIFYDKTFSIVGQPGVDAPQDSYAHVDVSTLNFPLKQVQYIGAGTEGINHIYGLFVSSGTGANTPVIFYTMKYTYTDS